MIEIIEIIEPSEQGRQRPFLCRGEDGQMYYVKGRQTDRISLWNEWICAHLAKELGLPMPDFSLVNIDESLIREVQVDWRMLGCGPAFASLAYPHALWFEMNCVRLVPQQLRKDVLMFDYWIRNLDRQKGNTNLLWDAEKSKMIVIDHNLAFDPDFSIQSFLEYHVFASDWDTIDMADRDEYARRFIHALGAARSACDNVPEEWYWADQDQTVEARLNIGQSLLILEQCTSDKLWAPV